MRTTFLLFCLAGALLARGETARAPVAARPPDVLSLRARALHHTPAERVRIFWRFGGEGLGGNVTRGEFTAVLPTAAKPAAATGGLEPDTGPVALEDAPADPDVLVESGKTLNYHWLKPGIWSPWAPLAALNGYFITVWLEGRTSGGNLKRATIEFECAYAGKVVKTFQETAPDHPTAGIVVPLRRLGKDGAPTPEFLAELNGLLAYVTRRADTLERDVGTLGALPKRFGIETDCGGYRDQPGYGSRTGNRAVMLAECRTLRLLGVNGFRNVPEFLYDQVRTGEGVGKEFARIRHSGGFGYPVPIWNTYNMTDKEKKAGMYPPVPPGAGCPYHPATRQLMAEIPAKLDKLMADDLRQTPLEECWLLTVDEIGTVFDGAPEGKEHMGCCPYCRAGFHEYLKSFGLGPQDFAAKSWDELRPTVGYNAKTWDERLKERAQQQQQKQDALPKVDTAAPGVKLADGPPAATAPKSLKSGTDTGAQDAIDTLDQQAAQAAPQASTAPAAAPPGHPLSDRGWSLLYYYTRRFNNDSSARLFSPIRDACNRQNELKRKAVAEGRADSPEGRQPWVYSYALRGPNFLWSGHSLDLFDFYRYADNGFGFETSNRDPRVWQWDSYMCDIGRTLNLRLGKRLCVYVKPHRGAPIQRALAAASRGFTDIYWYTYGPDWAKGDTFAGRPDLLVAVSRASRLLGGAEKVIYDAAWASPARVAVVRPRTAEFFGNSASWENGKWIYTALAHAHLPVDALDEEFLLTEDLSGYKALYISGSHLRRDVAVRLVQWVEAGGTLYTSGWGVACDEADQPLDPLLPAMGLKSRSAPEFWADVPGYHATGLGGLSQKQAPPEGSVFKGEGAYAGTFPLRVARETLEVADGTEILARSADGRPLLTCHAQGKGKVYVAGFYAGVEYASDVMKNEYDMATDFNALKRQCIAGPALAAGVVPAVDASHPLVDGVLLRNRASGKRAVVLMNWAYRGGQLVSLENLSIRVPGTAAGKAFSIGTGQPLAVEPASQDLVIRLPRLDAGDILMVE